MDTLHGIAAIIVLVAVMKWYTWAQMRYWCSLDWMDEKPELHHPGKIPKTMRQRGKRNA